MSALIIDDKIPDVKNERQKLELDMRLHDGEEEEVDIVGNREKND